jgi:creatinine amidohydrolase
MTQHPYFWSEMSTLDFQKIDKHRAIAVLPLAATEQHGPHLPVSVDADIVDGVIQASLPFLKQLSAAALGQSDAPQAPPSILFLPTQRVGLSPEHAAFPGTLTLKPETIVHLWTDIAESVQAAGIHKLVLFNAHGGHVGIMDVVARQLRARLGMLVYSVNWYQLPLLDAQGQDLNALFSDHEHRFGVHAGDIETSVMLALKPHAVQMEKAKHFNSSAEQRATGFDILGNGRSAKLAWQMQDYNAEGAAGNAANATPEKGRALLHAAGQSLAKLMFEIDRLPKDTLN